MSSPLRPESLAGRRTFIKTAAVAGVALAGWKPTLGRGRVLEKLNVASIGVGGMGKSDLAQIASHPEVMIVGLCDTDSNNLGAAMKLHPNAKGFADGREMFAKMGDEFDAVSITTPDHMHAIYAMMAMNGGKHVYCQKPLAWSVHENRALAKAAAANPSLATQPTIPTRVPRRTAATSASSTAASGPASDHAKAPTVAPTKSDTSVAERIGRLAQLARYSKSRCCSINPSLRVASRWAHAWAAARRASAATPVTRSVQKITESVVPSSTALRSGWISEYVRHDWRRSTRIEPAE